MSVPPCFCAAAGRAVNVATAAMRAKPPKGPKRVFSLRLLAMIAVTLDAVVWRSNPTVCRE